MTWEKRRSKASAALIEAKSAGLLRSLVPAHGLTIWPKTMLVDGTSARSR